MVPDDPDNPTPNDYYFRANTTAEAYRGYTKVVQTRHPLERLLSAYKFIFHRKQSRGDVRGLILSMFHMFPANEEEASYKEDDIWKVTPSFDQFVKYITEVENFGGVPDYPMGNHWMPQYHFCNPCYQLPGNFPEQVSIFNGRLTSLK